MIYRSFERALMALFLLIERAKNKGVLATFLLFPLFPLLLLSSLFGRLASWRLLLYERGILRVERLGCFVLSIGNLCSGGSGKTPVVEHFAHLLSPFFPGILSRGYGRRSLCSFLLINDQMGPLYSPKLCGDEPYLLALRAKVPIAIGKDRILSGRYMCSHSRAQVVLLDDGFQHRRLFRDCDILLIEARQLQQEPLCLPAGLQRNRLIDSSYADLVMVTGLVDQKQWCFALSKMKKVTKASIVGARFDLQGFIPLPTWRAQIGGLERGFDDEFYPLPETKIFVCSALARPCRFEQTLLRAGLKIVGKMHLPDHAPFDSMSAQRAHLNAQRCGAQAIVLTEKDAVKWAFEYSDLPIYIARSELKIVENRPVWDAFLANLQKRIALFR